MARSLSPIEQFAPEILECIGFHTGAKPNFLPGPPTHLVPLLRASRTINEVLSFKHNSHLYADLFRVKFDYGAPTRRLGVHWLTTHSLSSELRKRFTALKRIRNREFGHVDDLWTAYLLMMEGDGRNEVQVIEWAGIREYLMTILLFQARGLVDSSHTWFLESEEYSLVLWLFWMSSSAVSIRQEDLILQRVLLGRLHPLLVAGFRYPSVFAADSYHDLPICPEADVAPHSSGPSTPQTTITHFGHELTIAAPLLTTAAFLALTVRLETYQDTEPIPTSALSLPPNREAAVMAGRTGPTLEDVEEFHYHTRTRFVNRRSMTFDASNSGETSVQHDEDWYRLIACHDPWTGQTSLKGKVYSLGALSGCWSGRMMIPDSDAYWRLLSDPHALPSSVPVYGQPIFCQFQEHHCLLPDVPLASGTDASGLGDDVLNAWLPRGYTLKTLDEAIEVFDPTSGRHIRYETYFPDRAAPYSKAACEKLRTSTIIVDDQEEIAENISESGSVIRGDVPIDEEDDFEWSDYMELQCSGVADVLVTGETTERHGDAWGHFTYIGRVRSWDGLVILLRIPMFNTHAFFGRWVFKGYIHDQNFVGRWRETMTAVDTVGYEGGFVMCKNDGDS